MIKNVLLDLDDTLLDFHRAEQVAIAKTFSEMGLCPTDDIINRYSAINRSYWRRLEAGECTREEVLVFRFRDLYSELRVNIDPEKTRLLYEVRLSECAFFIDGAQELLDALYGKYRLFLCTNGTAIVQEPRIEKTGIARYFDGIFISQNIGYDKPARQYFDRCFDIIGAGERDRSVIVGDSLTSDIQGGINAGIKTLLYAPQGYNPCEIIKPDFVAQGLAQIPAIIERM
jgi:2-haloacid dehalogenase